MITLALIGGPADGSEHRVNADTPPMLWLVPVDQGPLGLLDDLTSPTPLQKAEYEPILDHGQPSRRDDGAYRYRHRSTPEPTHPGQRRPSPSLDELATLTRQPPRDAYPDNPAHLLACHAWHSLRRDAQLTPAERAAANAVSLDHMRATRHDPGR